MSSSTSTACSSRRWTRPERLRPCGSGTAAAGWRAAGRPGSRRYGRRPRPGRPRRSRKSVPASAMPDARCCSATQAAISQSALSQSASRGIGDLHLVAPEQHRIGADHRRDRAARADHRHRRSRIERILRARGRIGAEQIEDRHADRARAPTSTGRPQKTRIEQVEDEMDRGRHGPGSRSAASARTAPAPPLVAVSVARGRAMKPPQTIAQPSSPNSGDQQPRPRAVTAAMASVSRRVAPAVGQAHRAGRGSAQTNSIFLIS